MKIKYTIPKIGRQLLSTTFTEWNRLFVEEGPSVQDIVRQCPPLHIQRWVHFRALSNLNYMECGKYKFSLQSIVEFVL